MDNHHKKTRGLAILALITAVAGLSVAFAVLTQNLTISGTAQVKSASWDVRFGQTISTKPFGEASINGTRVDNHNITFSATFSAPGDRAELNFAMVNGGTINAVVDSITVGGASDLATDKIKYTLIYADSSGGATAGAPIAVGDALGANVTKNGKFAMIWEPTNKAPLSTDGSSITVTITVAFKQASS
jgi:hypothetical protein